MGIVRTDIAPIYLSDVENSSQRDFSSQPKGQSRYFKKPSDASLLAVLNVVAFLTIQGSNTSANINTSGTSNGTILKVRTKSSNSFTTITVTSGAAVTKTQIVTDLNNGFITAGLPLTARIAATNKITIDNATKGPSAYIELSSTGAALHTLVGLTADSGTSGLSVAALKAAVYPTATTIDVSSVTVTALSTFSKMLTSNQTTLVAAIADAVAPKLVETGSVLLSFALGIISKLNNAAFQPGGSRIGLPAGVAVAVLKDDGSTVFSL
jgi:hypothetical protein